MTGILKSFTNTVRYWYISLFLGIIFILCGIYTLTIPLETYFTLSVIFSLSFIVSGISEIFFSIENSNSLDGWGWYLVSGLISSLLGIYLLVYPQLSMAILPYIVGFTLLFRSFILLGISFNLREARILNWGNLALVSFIGVIFSFLLLANPIFTGLSLVMMTAASFIFIGISGILLAFELRKLKKYSKKLNFDIKEKLKSLQEEIKEFYNH